MCVVWQLGTLVFDAKWGVWQLGTMVFDHLDNSKLQLQFVSERLLNRSYLHVQWSSCAALYMYK